ncbi:hypothetical protein ALQ00_100782 [Pseudomonas syringae pv. tomato]|nr:hypothetical protein ALQ00_100782 [Pseudomonas syringae pv. tomato]RMV00811.1 hypothetical protein ALP19_100711 [Pseudomonas syringae pv. tomato]
MASVRTIWLGASGGIMHHVVVVSVAGGCPFVGGSGCGVMKGLLASVSRGALDDLRCGQTATGRPVPM